MLRSVRQFSSMFPARRTVDSVPILQPLSQNYLNSHTSYTQLEVTFQVLLYANNKRT